MERRSFLSFAAFASLSSLLRPAKDDKTELETGVDPAAPGPSKSSITHAAPDQPTGISNDPWPIRAASSDRPELSEEAEYFRHGVLTPDNAHIITEKLTYLLKDRHISIASDGCLGLRVRTDCRLENGGWTDGSKDPVRFDVKGHLYSDGTPSAFTTISFSDSHYLYSFSSRADSQRDRKDANNALFEFHDDGSVTIQEQTPSGHLARYSIKRQRKS